MNKMTYEEHLEKYGELTYTNVGVSMLPMLRQGRDIFTVKKKTDQRCRKYDVVLYRRPPSHYVLHRVVKVRENDYVICGDNCINLEYGIKDEDIIGVLTEFVRKGRNISVNNRLYRIYSVLWCGIFPVRRLFKKVKLKLGRMKRFLK
ncbi:MAG: S24/S26 family peptidase [Porcipelethomonas sp.]